MYFLCVLAQHASLFCLSVLICRFIYKLNLMSYTLDIKKKTSASFHNNLIVSDLDTFFTDIYDYYYNRGYSCIFTQTLLDNLSYLFSIHFTIFNLFLIDWRSIVKTCIEDNQCTLDILDFVSFENIFSFKFIVTYSMLMFYYIVFLVKSVLYVYRMKKIKHVYDTKLLIKQKEMVERRFDDIINRLCELQITENFCRVKETLTKFDIIARIMRKRNYIIALVSNNVLDFSIRIPFIGRIMFFTNYIGNNLYESLLKQAFRKDEVDINSQFFNLTLLQMKMFMHMMMEILCIPALLILKVIFWIFKNADNIKTNRNFTSKIWSSWIQIMFRNYNELEHHYENRISISYEYTEKFINCFKEKRLSLIRKFIVIICGSFLGLILIISSIDNRLLTDLKFYGRNLVFFTIIIGLMLSLSKDEDNNNRTISSIEESYIENLSFKETLYKKIVNSLRNTPHDWKYIQNMSFAYKKITKHYELSLWAMVKELLSMLLFPLIWIKIISQAKSIIRFFKMNSIKIEGVGTICVHSVMDYESFRSFKEKELLSNIHAESAYGEKKFINSFLYLEENFLKQRDIQIKKELYEFYSDANKDLIDEQEFMENINFYIAQVT